MLVLNADDVNQALPMDLAVSSMRKAMIALSTEQVTIPARGHLSTDSGTTLIMPGLVETNEIHSLAVKVVSIYNHNSSRGIANILGILNLFDPTTGKPVAMIDGAAVTAIRTAATSAAATAGLARQKSTNLAIIGSGTQADSHFRAILSVCPIKHVSVFARNQQRVAELVAGWRSMVSDSRLDQIEFTIAASSADATRHADIVCTVTNSSQPVIDDQAIKPGCHINAIGSYKPEVAEIPAATVARSRIYVDHLESALAEAGDLIQPINTGAISTNSIVGEIGHLFDGSIEGRDNDQAITLFKSVGHTVEDVVAAQVIYENAVRKQLGQSVDF